MDGWKRPARKKLGQGESQKWEDQRWGKSDGESQKREDAGAWKGRKVAKPCVFSTVLWLRRVEKSAGAEPARQMKDEKLHPVVVRSTFASQNVQNTSGSDHFWKWTCTKHCSLEALLEVQVLKKCTPLWREARLEVKMWKFPHVRAIYGRPEVVQMSKNCTLLWREAHFQVKSAKMWWFSSNFEVSVY